MNAIQPLLSAADPGGLRQVTTPRLHPQGAADQALPPIRPTVQDRIDICERLLQLRSFWAAHRG